MQFSPVIIDNVFHPRSPQDKRIRNQRTMASPGNCLGAHECATVMCRKLHDPVHIFHKFLSLHIVRIAAEGRIAPTLIDRVLACVPKTAQAGQMRILDACCTQGIRQGFLIELGIMPRAGHRSYIEQVCNFVYFHQIDEFIKGMG